MQPVRIERVEQVREGVVARDSVPQYHELPQDPLLHAPVPLHVGAVLPARKEAQERNHEHLLEVMPGGVAAPGVVHPVENAAYVLHCFCPVHLFCGTSETIPEGSIFES